MVFLRALVAALAIAAVGGQGGKGEPDMAQMMEMMSTLSPDEQEEAMKMMKGGGKGMGGKGGMDGTGGKGGKGGPAPKEMTVQKARSMMKELRGALNSAVALEAFASLESEGKGRIEKAAPMAEAIVESVLNKYEIEPTPDGGIQYAVQSAMAAGAGDGQTDKKIRAAVEDVEEKITGKASHTRLGRVASLDALAEKFRGMDAAARSAALAETAGVPGGELYLETMNGIVESGDTYVVRAIVELVHLMNEEGAENKTDM